MGLNFHIEASDVPGSISKELTSLGKWSIAVVQLIHGKV